MHYIFILMILSISGCAKLAHIDEGLRLQAFSREKDAQAVEVTSRDAAFDRMRSDFQAQNKIAGLKTGFEVRRVYGEPVLTRLLPDRPGYTELMYRHQVEYSHTPKIYIVTGPDDRIEDVRFENAP